MKRKPFSDEDGARHSLFTSLLCKMMKTKSAGLAGVTAEITDVVGELILRF